MWISERGIAHVPPWTLQQRPKKPSLKTFAGWRYLFRRHYPIQWITLSSSPQEVVSAGRVAHDGRSFELHLGDIQLRFQPEIALGVKKKSMEKNWIINTEQGCSTKNITGFVRIKVGETIVVGQCNDQYSELFQFNESVAIRHVSISNRKGDLSLTPLSTEKSTEIIRLDDLDYRERLERGRHKSLLDIQKLYGQQISPLPAYRALEVIREVNTILMAEPFRPKNSSGVPGGIIELTEKTTPVFVGDLHGQVDNLLKILSENCLLDCLRMKTATLIIIGDAVHSEIVGEMDRFESSMLIMDLIFTLKMKFPKNFFYLRGNHDSFSPDINKSGFLQGELFKEELLAFRGQDYVKEMEDFYDNLPLLIYSEDFLACHAGPPRKQTSRKELVEANTNEKLIQELTKNRLARPNYLAGYDKQDVKKLRKSLKLSAKARFIVGHTPLDPFNSYWLHAGAIKNHHIVYSGHTSGASIIIKTETSFMPISFPAEPLADIINNLS
jgi:hypothetical protein